MVNMIKMMDKLDIAGDIIGTRVDHRPYGAADRPILRLTIFDVEDLPIYTLEVRFYSDGSFFSVRY